jgi:hypothetical protein
VKRKEREIRVSINNFFSKITNHSQNKILQMKTYPLDFINTHRFDDKTLENSSKKISTKRRDTMM